MAPADPFKPTCFSLSVIPIACHVAPPSPSLQQAFSLSPHYTKVLMVDDFPILATKQVEDAALMEAGDVVRKMLKNRSDILKKLAENRIRRGIMAVSERTCDLPEHTTLKPTAYWYRRARGLGATRERPAVSCGEENVLHNPGDPYPTESIMVHEFAHAIHLMTVNKLDPTFDKRLEKTYEDAMCKGL